MSMPVVNPLAGVAGDCVVHQRDSATTFVARVIPSVPGKVLGFGEDGVLAGVSGGGVIDVRDYGAVGNGSTDDTASIQAAINACPLGGIVRVPFGTFKITAPLMLKSQMRIMGDGRTGSCIINYGNTSALKATTTVVGGFGTRLIYISDLYIADALTDVTRTAGHGIEIDGEGDAPVGGSGDLAIVSIERVTIDRHFDGINLKRAITSTLRDVRVTSARRDSFAVSGTSTSVAFEGTYSSAAVRHGYHLQTLQYSTLQNTAADSNHGNAYHLYRCVGITLISPGMESNYAHGVCCVNSIGIVVTGPKIEGISQGDPPAAITIDGIRFEGTVCSSVIGGDIRNVTGCGVRCLASDATFPGPITPVEIDLRAINYVSCAGGNVSDTVGGTISPRVVGSLQATTLGIGVAPTDPNYKLLALGNALFGAGSGTAGKIRVGEWSTQYIDVGCGGGKGYYIQAFASGPARLDLNPDGGVVVVHAAATGYASLRVPAGVAPTAPAEGDIWHDGTHLYCRIGGVTKQLDN